MHRSEITWRLVEIAEAFTKAERLVDDLVDDPTLTVEQKAAILSSPLGIHTERANACRALAESITEQKDAA